MGLLSPSVHGKKRGVPVGAASAAKANLGESWIAAIAAEAAPTKAATTEAALSFGVLFFMSEFDQDNPGLSD